METTTSRLVVSFRNRKSEFILQPSLSIRDVKASLIGEERQSSSNDATNDDLSASDIKLLFKGNATKTDDDLLATILTPAGKRIYKMIAVGRSTGEVKAIRGEQAEAKERAPRIRDDLTREGQRDMERRRVLGRQMMRKASRRELVGAGPHAEKYGFGPIETLPNLPDEDKARAILTKLATDPGILACMKKHKWRVGSLAELYPEGKVGETAVCVLGLNRNRGQQILLRIRTDDLKGFRKMLSIRKVLFHELAHNVHSEHDGKFFQLNRQIEKECNEMDWTEGEGISDGGNDSLRVPMQPYSGGAFRLGGNTSNGHGSAGSGDSARELRARAALGRLTAEEEEIHQHCGCGREAKFLPRGLQPNGDGTLDTAADAEDTA